MLYWIYVCLHAYSIGKIIKIIVFINEDEVQNASVLLNSSGGANEREYINLRNREFKVYNIMNNKRIRKKQRRP